MFHVVQYSTKNKISMSMSISSFQLVSVAEQAGLSVTCSQTPKTGFLVTRLKYTVLTCTVDITFFLTGHSSVWRPFKF